MPGTTKPEPAKWEITGITLRCESIDDYVTLTVTREWMAKCTWCHKYKPQSVEKAPRIKKTIREKIEKCTGPDCPVVTKYREKLIAEEAAKK